MEPVDPRIDPALVPAGSRALVIAEHQDEYTNLPSVRTPPVFVDGRLVTPPQVITRWSLTDEERKRVLLGEDVFVTLISNGAINPLFVTIGPVDWK